MNCWLAAHVAACLIVASASADVPVVDNPREVPHTTTVTYEEVWRAGADDAAEFIFGTISDAATDENGNVYLLDTQQQQVFKFSADGEYRGLVSRKGEGPGEIDRVYGLNYLGKGRLVMLKTFPTKLVLVDTAGVALEDIPLRVSTETSGGNTFFSVMDLAAWGEHLVGQGTINTFNGNQREESSFVAAFRTDGSERHRFGTWKSGYDFTRAIVVDEIARYHPLNIWTMDRQGRVYHAVARDAYAIEVRTLEGKLLRRIQRDWQPHQRTPEEKEEAKNGYSFSSNTELPPISYDMADHDPAIVGLSIMGDELWVSRAEARRHLPAGINGAVDVFDLEGHLIEERRFAVPIERKIDRAVRLSDGRVVRVKAFRSAHAAAYADLKRQHGEERGPDADVLDAEILEVIVYRPVSD